MVSTKITLAASACTLPVAVPSVKPALPTSAPSTYALSCLLWCLRPSHRHRNVLSCISFPHILAIPTPTPSPCANHQTTPRSWLPLHHRHFLRISSWLSCPRNAFLRHNPDMNPLLVQFPPSRFRPIPPQHHPPSLAIPTPLYPQPPSPGHIS